MRYAFGEFVLDSEMRQLFRAGREIALAGKAFDLLELLLRDRPRALSRTRLCLALWPDTHVGPTSLHVLVSQVRAALHDAAEEPRWIRTVPRFGYAFAGTSSPDTAAVSEPPSGVRPGHIRPRLVFERGEIVLVEGENLIGREPGVTIRLDTAGVSRRHACIVLRGAEATISDLGSKNGTFVREERLSAPAVLEEGDAIRLGREVRFIYFCAVPTETKTDAP